MKILLVDDHELFREGIKLLLADLAEACTFTEAADLATALRLAAAEHYDIVLLDYHLPGSSGADGMRLLRSTAEHASIVVLSGEEDPALIRRVIEDGAAGFIPKASSHAMMLAALRLILAGGTYLPPHVLAIAPTTQSAGAPAGAGIDQLTGRQLATLRLAMQGKANKSIAREMDVSEATVKAHLSSAFRALGVRNRTEAVFVAARSGLTI